MAKSESVALERSGIVLRRLHTRCEMYGPIDPTPVLFQVKALADGTGFQACFASSWHNGTRDECLAWIDEKALKFRAALLPHGAFVVSDSPETRETTRQAVMQAERSIVSECTCGDQGAGPCATCNNRDEIIARAVLAALKEAAR